MLFYRQLEYLQKSFISYSDVSLLCLEGTTDLQLSSVHQTSDQCVVLHFRYLTERDFLLAVELAFVISSFVWYSMMFRGS